MYELSSYASYISQRITKRSAVGLVAVATFAVFGLAALSTQLTTSQRIWEHAWDLKLAQLNMTLKTTPPPDGLIMPLHEHAISSQASEAKPHESSVGYTTDLYAYRTDCDRQKEVLEQWRQRFSATLPSPVSAGSTLNRTLVVLIGQARGGPQAWASLFENVLDVSLDHACCFGC